MGIAGTALGLLNGGLGKIFGGLGAGTDTPYSCTHEDDRFVNKDTFWRQNIDIQKEFGRQEYDSLKANYELYITLDNKISALQQNQATVNAQLPLMFQLANMAAERYTDDKVCPIKVDMATGFGAVEYQLAQKMNGTLGLPWSSIITGIPTMPACTMDVTCPGK